MARTPTAPELKRELLHIVRVITDADDGRAAERYEEAARALAALRAAAAVASKKNQEIVEPLTMPKLFLCPISGELMKDPVILSSGQTYDRPYIQEWLNSGNRTCPRTQQVLSNTILIPNDLVRRMITQWCIEHSITLPPIDLVKEEGLVTVKERNTLEAILSKISKPSSLAEQKQTVRELRLLTRRNRSFRAVVGESPNTIPKLISVLSVPGLNCDPEVQEDTVTTILNLSIHDSNKKIVGENPQAIPLLIDALKSGTMETRSNSAAALFSLSALESNKLKIGELGAMKPLVELLENGNPVAKKDAASAIFNLCMVYENRVRAVREAAIGVILCSIGERSLVDESLAILALLSGDQEAVEEISAISGVPCLLSILRDCSSARNKENAIVVLFAVCMYDRKRLREVGEEENLSRTISQLAQSGTSRARRKASGVLDKLKRTFGVTHYSC